jgi:cobalt-zinc-cadmium efflux system membrane fusion protein
LVNAALLLGLLVVASGCGADAAGKVVPGAPQAKAEPAAEAVISPPAAEQASDGAHDDSGSSPHAHGDSAEATHGHDDGGAPHEHGGASDGPDDAGAVVVALTAVERDNIDLKTVPAAVRPLEDVRQVPGVIKAHPDRVALVTSQLGGKVAEIPFQIGQRVARGQPLVGIQSAEVTKLEIEAMQAESRYRAERARLELELAQAEAKLGSVQAEVERHRMLVDKGIGARKELIAAESELRTVENEIAGGRQQLQLLARAFETETMGLMRQFTLLGVSPDEVERARRGKRASLLRIPAPLSGIIVERPVNLGQTIEPSTTLFKIIDDSKVIAEGDAFEDMLSSLSVGQPARVTTVAHPGRVFEGRVSFIDPAIDPEKRTARIWVEIRNPRRELKQDMFAQVGVVIGGGKPTVAVPVESVIAAEGGHYVFVERDGGFAWVPIAAGTRNDRWVEVRRGIKGGDRVVTVGQRQLYTKFLAQRSGGAVMGGDGHGHSH